MAEDHVFFLSKPGNGSNLDMGTIEQFYLRNIGYSRPEHNRRAFVEKFIEDHGKGETGDYVIAPAGSYSTS